MRQATRAQLEDNASSAPFRFVALRFGDTASLWPANSDAAAQRLSLAYWTRAAGGDDDFSVMVLARVWCQLAVLGRARVVRNRGMACTDAITSRLASGVACRVCRPRVQAGTVMHSVVRLLCFSALAFLLPKTHQCAVISVHSRRSGPGLGSRAAPCWRSALRQSAGSLRRRGAVTKQCPGRLCALSQRSHCPPGAPTSPVGGESIKLILAVWLHDMLAI